jgi:hypothetical protein
MRTGNAQFELFDAAHVPVGSGTEEGGRVGNCQLGGMARRARKYKNSGNEAKKYLKTKDITFLQCANYARFARNLRPIRPLKEQESRRLAKTSCNLGVEGPCWKVTHCRLVGAVREPPLHALFTRGVAQTCRSLACLRHCQECAYIPTKYVGTYAPPWFFDPAPLWLEKGADIPTKGVGTYAPPVASDNWHLAPRNLAPDTWRQAPALRVDIGFWQSDNSQAAHKMVSSAETRRRGSAVQSSDLNSRGSGPGQYLGNPTSVTWHPALDVSTIPCGCNLLPARAHVHCHQP